MRGRRVKEMRVRRRVIRQGPFNQREELMHGMVSLER